MTRWREQANRFLDATGVYPRHCVTVVASESSPQRPRMLHLWPEGHRYGTLPRRGADLTTATACGRQLDVEVFEYADRGEWAHWLEQLDQVWWGPDGRRICRECLSSASGYPECGESSDYMPLEQHAIDAITRELTALATEALKRHDSEGSFPGIPALLATLVDRYRELLLEQSVDYAHANARQVLQRLLPSEERRWRDGEDYWALADRLRALGCRVPPEELLDRTAFAELVAPKLPTAIASRASRWRADDVAARARALLLERARAADATPESAIDKLASPRPGRQAHEQLDGLRAAIADNRLHRPFAALSHYRELAGQRPLLRDLMRDLVTAVSERSGESHPVQPPGGDPDDRLRTTLALDDDAPLFTVVVQDGKRRLRHHWRHSSTDPSADDFAVALCGTDLSTGVRSDTSTARICADCEEALSRTEAGKPHDVGARGGKDEAAGPGRLATAVEEAATRRLRSGLSLDEPTLLALVDDARDGIAQRDRGASLAEHGEFVLQRLLGPGEYLRLRRNAGDEPLTAGMGDEQWATLADDVATSRLKDVQRVLGERTAPPPFSGRGGAPSWDQHFAALQQFHDRHGHTRVHRDQVTDDGIKLGGWLRNQRQAAKGGEEAHIGAPRAARCARSGLVGPTPEDDEPVAVEVVPYTDAGTGRDLGRPAFERLLAELGKPRDEPLAVCVSDLSRLFRSRHDRDRLDRLLHDGRTEVMTVREDISTTDPGGLERYERVADLLMLAYEGEWRTFSSADTRADVVDAFVDGALVPWLTCWGAGEDQLAQPVEDVRNRLDWLLARWDDPDRLEPLLTPFLELARLHEPAELPLRLRALALVGVRNSALEDLHLDDVIAQSDWRLLTQAAAHALAPIEAAPGPVRTTADDPFANVVEDNPTATAAFRLLADLEPGHEIAWTPPDVESRGLPQGDGPARLMDDGFEIRHAMDDYVSTRLAQGIEQVVAQRAAFAIPSLKHISRNPHKLFRVVDALLAHGATVATANVKLSPTTIARRDVSVDYNDQDFAWAGVDAGALETTAGVGRNDPCPCGSGKKFKRCCGA